MQRLVSKPYRFAILALRKLAPRVTSSSHFPKESLET